MRYSGSSLISYSCIRTSAQCYGQQGNAQPQRAAPLSGQTSHPHLAILVAANSNLLAS